MTAGAAADIEERFAFYDVGRLWFEGIGRFDGSDGKSIKRSKANHGSDEKSLRDETHRSSPS